MLFNDSLKKKKSGQEDKKTKGHLEVGVIGAIHLVFFAIRRLGFCSCLLSCSVHGRSASSFQSVQLYPEVDDPYFGRLFQGKMFFSKIRKCILDTEHKIVINVIKIE